jgi:hypothetical protein
MKKEPYEKRRRQVVIGAVQEKLAALKKAEELGSGLEIDGGAALLERGMTAKTVFLCGLLLDERGWRKSNTEDRDGMPSGLAWGDLTRLQNHSIGSGEVRDGIFGLCRRLLRLAVGCLHDRLHVQTGDRMNDAQYAEAERICQMLGFDLAALRAHAADRIPYAKAWKDVVEDEWVSSEASAEGAEEMTA